MDRCLLIVEDSFDLAGRGLVLAPPVGANLAKLLGDRQLEVLLRRPDGNERPLQVHLRWEIFNPGGSKLMCFPDALDKLEIPIGSELWFEQGPE